MNDEARGTQLVFWQWGRNVGDSVAAVMLAEDVGELEAMAKDLINGKVKARGSILPEFVKRTHDLSSDTLFRLARRYPKCLPFAKQFVSRPDAEPEQLDKLAGREEVASAVAMHRKTSRRTIDRMFSRTPPGGELFSCLVCSASLPLLEKLTKKCDHILLCLRVADETINPAVLRRLAFHHRECIRHMVLDNMFTSSAILNEMALREEHVEILLRIVPQLKSKGVLNRLAERLCDLKSEKLARAILKNRWASDYAKTMTALARPQ